VLDGVARRRERGQGVGDLSGELSAGVRERMGELSEQAAALVRLTAVWGRSLGASDAGRLLLRVALGVLILLHGLFKVTHGAGMIVGMVQKAGLPSAFGYAVYIGEVVAPLLLILGLWTRAAAVVIAINMVVAIALAHQAQIFTLNQQGGWAIELQGLYLFTALAIALLGAGRFSIGGSNGRFN
jgi:putative oxidoreductase